MYIDCRQHGTRVEVPDAAKLISNFPCEAVSRGHCEQNVRLKCSRGFVDQNELYHITNRWIIQNPKNQDLIDRTFLGA